MKVVAISDIHNHQVDLPEGDLLIVAGDLTSSGKPVQITNINEYLARQAPKFKHKPIVVAGNHDFMFERQREDAIQALNAADYLEDNYVEIAGVKIYGSPWTPTFFNWAFMKDRGREIREVWESIPDGLDILVTHGPPMGILDFCGQHAGCADLLEVVTQKLASPPRFHVFGHIHEGYGSHSDGRTTYLNVSVCDADYKPVNAPTVFEV